MHTVWDDELRANAIDLAALVKERRQKERKQAAKEEVVCDQCKDTVRRGRLKAHQKTLRCKTDAKMNALKARDMETIFDSGVLARACKIAGVELIEERTAYFKGGRHNPEESRKETWVTKWLARLFNDTYGICRAVGFDESDAAPYFAEVISQAVADEGVREALFATQRMSGVKGLATLVFSNKVRAAKLRREAAELDKKAAKKREDADALDPPSENGGE